MIYMQIVYFTWLWWVLNYTQVYNSLENVLVNLIDAKISQWLCWIFKKAFGSEINKSVWYQKKY